MDRREHPRRLVAVLLAMAVALPALTLPSASEVRADCGGSGRYARTPSDVRGTAFIGVYEGYRDASGGDAIVRWDVLLVVTGDIPTGTFRKRTFECALTLLLPGERYLFSTGAGAGEGMASYANSIAWRTDDTGATLAPFVDQQDPPQVAQDITRMPRWAREVATVDAAIALVTGGEPPTGPGVSPSPTASPVPQASSSSSPAPVGSEPYPFRPGSTVVPGGLPWEGVAAPLSGERWLSDLTAWSGGFAAVERPQESDIEGAATALWVSADGLTWNRTSLPEGVREVWRPVPFRDGLVLAVRDGPITGDAIELRLWRTPDGTRWRRAGSFRATLPAGLDAPWRMYPTDLHAVAGRLVLLGIIAYNPSGGWSPHGPLLASVGALALTRTSRSDRLVAWTSRDGDRWVRRTVRGATDSRGGGELELVSDAPGGLLALRLGGYEDPVVLSSRDGLSWSEVARLPDDYDEVGGEGLLAPAGPILLFADSGQPRPDADGNRLGGWLLQRDGSWTVIVDRQPATTYAQAGDGDVVIVVMAGLDAWASLLVSLDGGRSWDPDLSWTGATGSCLADVAIRDGVAVMVGCDPTQPALWAATLPAEAVPPSTSPAPVPDASTSPEPSEPSTPSPLALWSPVDPSAIPFEYFCGDDRLRFTASDLVAPAGQEAAPGPVGDALRRLGTRLDPPTGWRIAAEGETSALVVTVVDDRRRTDHPLYTFEFVRDGDGWRWDGSHGDCRPWARLDDPPAVGGAWRLDPAFPAPSASSRVLHALVTYAGCPQAVDLRGRPRVATTDEAVIVVVPVVATSNSDSCSPGEPTPVTIRLPEALSGRTLYDAATLPMREVRVRR